MSNILFAHIAVAEFILICMAVLIIWALRKSNKIWKDGWIEADAELRKRDMLAKLRDEKARAEARAVMDECWTLLGKDPIQALRETFQRCKERSPATLAASSPGPSSPATPPAQPPL